MASVRHLEFAKFLFFCQNSIFEMEICISAPNLIEIGNSWLRYGDKAIFKMAAVRHLEFSEIAIFVTCMRFFISGPNIALIGQYGAEI